MSFVSMHVSGGSDLPNVEMGKMKKDDEISNKEAEHIKKLASSMSFSNLLATLDNEFENADNLEGNQKQLPSYKKKRAIFESVWKDREGITHINFSASIDKSFRLIRKISSNLIRFSRVKASCFWILEITLHSLNSKYFESNFNFDAYKRQEMIFENPSAHVNNTLLNISKAKYSFESRIFWSNIFISLCGPTI